MVSSQEVLDSIHVNLHAIRLQQGYKPSQFEIKVSYLVTTLYADKCPECKAVLEDKRKHAENQMAGNVPMNQGKGFLDKVLGR